MKDIGRLTAPEYWDRVWTTNQCVRPFDINGKGAEGYFDRLMHLLFCNTLGHPTDTSGKRLIELGCGGSRWLPYFARYFGFIVYGIDYSQDGIELAQNMLDLHDINGHLKIGDFFDPPEEWIEYHDVAVSFGLVEHFQDTAAAVTACARYVRPGGIIFTLVPTMLGLYGLAYRLLKKDIYRRHKPLSRHDLIAAHLRCGLNVYKSGYLLGLPVIISSGGNKKTLRLAHMLSDLYCKIEESGFGVPPNVMTSPYCYCAAIKPQKMCKT